MTPDAPRPRRYPDAGRAAALAALDATAGNLKRTADQLGIPRKTLEGWAKGRSNPVSADLRDGAKRDLADALEAWAGKLIGIDPASLPSLSLRDVGVAVGVAVDKLLLLRGRPTAITSTHATTGPDPAGMTDAELAAHIARLRAEAAGAAGAGDADDPGPAAEPETAPDPDPGAPPDPGSPLGGGGAGGPAAGPGGGPG